MLGGLAYPGRAYWRAQISGRFKPAGPALRRCWHVSLSAAQQMLWMPQRRGRSHCSAPRNAFSGLCGRQKRPQLIRCTTHNVARTAAADASFISDQGGLEDIVTGPYIAWTSQPLELSPRAQAKFEYGPYMVIRAVADRHHRAELRAFDHVSALQRIQDWASNHSCSGLQLLALWPAGPSALFPGLRVSLHWGRVHPGGGLHCSVETQRNRSGGGQPLRLPFFSLNSLNVNGDLQKRAWRCAVDVFYQVEGTASNRAPLTPQVSHLLQIVAQAHASAVDVIQTLASRMKFDTILSAAEFFAEGVLRTIDFRRSGTRLGHIQVPLSHGPNSVCEIVSCLICPNATSEDSPTSLGLGDANGRDFERGLQQKARTATHDPSHTVRVPLLPKNFERGEPAIRDSVAPGGERITIMAKRGVRVARDSVSGEQATGLLLEKTAVNRYGFNFSWDKSAITDLSTITAKKVGEIVRRTIGYSSGSGMQYLANVHKSLRNSLSFNPFRLEFVVGDILKAFSREMSRALVTEPVLMKIGNLEKSAGDIKVSIFVPAFSALRLQDQTLDNSPDMLCLSVMGQFPRDTSQISEVKPHKVLRSVVQSAYEVAAPLFAERTISELTDDFADRVARAIFGNLRPLVLLDVEAIRVKVGQGDRASRKRNVERVVTSEVDVSADQPTASIDERLRDGNGPQSRAEQIQDVRSSQGGVEIYDEQLRDPFPSSPHESVDNVNQACVSGRGRGDGSHEYALLESNDPAALPEGLQQYHDESSDCVLDVEEDGDDNTIGRNVYIAFGSNVGDRLEAIEAACRAIDEDPDMRIIRSSAIYETDPMYITNQNRFLNGVCSIETSTSPLELLEKLQAIEKQLGRVKTVDKGPRRIDLDILLYGQAAVNSERLTVPHPRILERPFVLQPLSDIYDGRLTPLSDGRAKHHLAELRKSQESISLSPLTPLGPKHQYIRAHAPKRPTRIMSILNVTPDSFSDGGVNSPDNTEALRNTIREHVAAGATIIDVGGQSSRPYAPDIAAEEEIARVLPAIEAIKSLPEATDVAISVDTYRASVAKAAIAAGAHIVNDISAGQLDSEMLPTIAKLGCTYIMMHMRGTPTTMQCAENTSYPGGLAHTIITELQARLEAAQDAGIRRWRIIVDPGVGFAKTVDQNIELLRSLQRLRSGGPLQNYPLLVGSSRKSFIGKVTGVEEPTARTWGTAATVTVAVSGGAEIVRVHDVREMMQVVRMADAIYRS